MKVGWFSSGRGPGSQALLAAALAAIDAGTLPVDIAYLFCNRDSGEHAPADQLFAQATARGIPVVTLSSAAFRRQAGGEIARLGKPLPAWRRDYDRAILRLIEPFGAQFAVLAGYQLIAPELCRSLDLINLHPAAPGGPVGLWQEVIWQLIGERAHESGVTIFRAIPELDAGPPISFCRYSLADEGITPLWHAVSDKDVVALRASEGENLPLFREIRRRGAAREAPLLLATIAALAEGRMRLRGGQLVDSGGAPTTALDLTASVESASGSIVYSE